MKTQRSVPLTMLCAAALAAACVTLDKDSYIRSRTADVVYEMPIEEVWPHAMALIREQGFVGREVPGSFVFESEWREDLGPSRIAGSFTRYVVEGRQLSPERCRVYFIKVNKLARDTYTDRNGEEVPLEQMALRGATASGDPAQAEDGQVRGPTTNEASKLQWANENNSGSLERATEGRFGNRDLGMEFLLLKRISPEGARQIEAEAEKYSSTEPT